MAVCYLEGTGTRPPRDGLRVGADFLEVRQIGIEDGRMRRVHCDPAASALVRIAVQVATSEGEVMWDFPSGHPAVAQLDEVVDEGAFFRPQLDPHQPIMMRARGGLDGGSAGCDQLGHQRGGGRIDAGPREWKTRVFCAPDGDPSSAVFAGKREGSKVDPVHIERDRVAGRCLVQGPLEVRAVRDRKSTRLNSSHMSISYAVF